MKLKVCGMRETENILDVANLQPDYMGLIFYERSPRFVENSIPELSSDIKRTGVFVNATIDFILIKAHDYKLKAIQLHGEESSEFCKELKSALNKEIEIIKVFSIKESFNFEELASYEGIVDFFLFDTKGKNKGGNGTVFNWNVLKEYPSQTPFFLSGGIGLEEIEEIKSLHTYFLKDNRSDLLYAVDVNSKFEISPGNKNAEQLFEFQKQLQQIK